MGMYALGFEKEQCLECKWYSSWCSSTTFCHSGIERAQCFSTWDYGLLKLTCEELVKHPAYPAHDALWPYYPMDHLIRIKTDEEKKIASAKGGLLNEDQPAFLVLKEDDFWSDDGSSKVEISKERINALFDLFRKGNATSVTLKYQFGFKAGNVVTAIQQLLSTEGFGGWVINLIADQLCVGVLDVIMKTTPAGEVVDEAVQHIGSALAKRAYKEAAKRGMTKTASRELLFEEAGLRAAEEATGYGLEETLNLFLDNIEFCLVDMLDNGGETSYEVEYLVEWKDEVSQELKAHDVNAAFMSKGEVCVCLLLVLVANTLRYEFA